MQKVKNTGFTIFGNMTMTKRDMTMLMGTIFILKVNKYSKIYFYTFFNRII